MVLRWVALSPLYYRSASLVPVGPRRTILVDRGAERQVDCCCSITGSWGVLGIVVARQERV